MLASILGRDTYVGAEIKFLEDELQEITNLTFNSSREMKAQICIAYLASKAAARNLCGGLAATAGRGKTGFERF